MKPASRLALVALLWSAGCSAHSAGAASSAADSLFTGLLVIAACSYAIGWLRLSTRGAKGTPSAMHRVLFALAIGSLVLAFHGPLDEMAESSFAAHMAQHLLLMLVAPLLLVLARPGPVWLWALSRTARHALARATAPWASRARRVLLHPPLVYAYTSLTFWFWHLPGPYDAALAQPWLHALEHAMLFATSAAFWSLVLPAAGRHRHAFGSMILYVATFGMQNGLLGALLTFARRPIYAAYSVNGPFGLTPLQDQQLAGLLMWVPASAFHLCTITVLFTQWMRFLDQRATRTVASRPPVSLNGRENAVMRRVRRASGPT